MDAEATLFCRLVSHGMRATACLALAAAADPVHVNVMNSGVIPDSDGRLIAWTPANASFADSRGPTGVLAPSAVLPQWDCDRPDQFERRVRTGDELLGVPRGGAGAGGGADDRAPGVSARPSKKAEKPA